MAKTDSLDRRTLMETASPYVVIPKLALPSIIAMIVDSLYNLADTFFVSSIGQNATAAVAVNDSFMQILLAVGSAFSFGCSGYISRLLGAKEDDRASRVASTTLVCSLGTALCFMAILWPLRVPLVKLFGSTESAAQYSVDYATWIIFAFPFTASISMLSQLLKAEGNTKMSMIGTVSGCLINCVLDPLFINVFDWEVAGAAGATAISKMCSCFILAIPFIKKKTLITLSKKNICFDKDDIKEVARMGIPTFARQLLMSTGGVLTNRAARLYDTAALAGVSIANKIYKLIASSILGFAHAFTPVAGYNYGAKNYKRVREMYYATCKMGFSAAIVLGVVMWFVAPDLVNIFNSEMDPAVTAIGTFKLKVLCLGYIPHIFVVVTNHFFQALGKPVGNTILGMSRQLIFLIPYVLILPKFFGAYGVAAAQGLSDMSAGIFIAIPCALHILNGLKKLESEQ